MGTTSLFSSGIRPAIDEWLKKESEKIRDYGEYWSASSAGYCMRKNIFERLGVPPVSEDARKQRVFSSGHIFHEWLQAITKEAGLSIAQELELQDEELMIRGHFDDLVLVREFALTDPDGSVAKEEVAQHLILYDYKTAHSKWFEYVKDRPMSYYNKMQLGTYMYMLRKILESSSYRKVQSIISSNLWNIEQPLTEARILKISKDDLRLHEQQLMWSDELEKEVVDYWSQINRWWADKKIPPCTCADHEGGFMSKPKWNPYFYEGEPCSLAWHAKWKKEKK